MLYTFLGHIHLLLGSTIAVVLITIYFIKRHKGDYRSTEKRGESDDFSHPARTK
jgi:hypothetical protein